MQESTILGLITILSFMTFMAMNKNEENFTATGLVYNIPPGWWFPQQYNSTTWLTPYYPEQLSSPTACQPSLNRGNAADLNYMSSSYRFWRM